MKSLLESQFKAIAELPEGYKVVPTLDYATTVSIQDATGKEVGWMHVNVLGYEWVQDWVNSDKELLKQYPQWGYQYARP